MKIGSLVECKATFKKRNDHEIDPQIGEIYTVRSFFKGDERDTYIRLQEIKNPKLHYSNGFAECGFNRSSFQEVQPPINVSALFENQLKVNQP